MRVQLRPGLRRAWRSPTSLQVGLDPRLAIVVDGLEAGDAALVERLIGGVDVADVDAGLVPPGPARGREVIASLRSAGVIVPWRAGRAALARLGSARQRLASDAAVWALTHPQVGDGWGLVAARAGRLVEVRGSGRTCAAITTCLTAAGLPIRTPDPGRDGADLVVLVDHAVADAAGADDLVGRDIPHLSVVIRETGAVVGPLVVPGRGPCLRCLDLHRTDRDPGWPRVLAQVLADATPQPEEAALSALAGALAAVQVLTYLDGVCLPSCLGATLEVGLPQGLVGRRPWPTHASCGCHWPLAAPSGRSPETMPS